VPSYADHVFSNLGLGEIALLAIVGLVIFGPERLPKAIKDAGRILRELRTMARGAATDLKAELGPEMADLDLRSLHPRRFVEQALFGEDEPDPGSTPVGRGAAVVTLSDGERPPYDPDAT
jgi:sec-independent protein translocase protein TatB